MCVRACNEACVREGGLSDGGPIGSSGVLCIVIAAAGCCSHGQCVRVCVRVCADLDHFYKH